LNALARVFDTSDFPARWSCGNWSAAHGWLHILSDLGVWSAYVAIPVVLAVFALRRTDLPFRKVFLLFGAFILACGTTHLMEAIIFWWPAYRLAGGIKLFTAVVSWATVLALIPIIPRVLSMRSPEELERMVAERTAELVRANADLKLERERFRTTLTSIGDAVIATDADGRVAFINPVAEHLTGWTAGAVGNKLADVFDIVNEDTGAAVESPVDKVLRDGVTVGLANHTVLRARDGAARPIDDSAAPIRDEHGRVVGSVLVFRDISARKRVEAELRDADRKKDEFLALLAHELRNPLAPIRNGLEIVRRSPAAGEAFARVRGIMERQVAHLVRMVDDLLDVSRISRGKVALKKERVDLAAVARSAVETVEPTVRELGHELTVALPPAPVVADGDPTRLAQAVGNLLTNAVKYTDPGGRIWLTVERQGGEAVVTVRDTGIGIPAEVLPKVFDLFTQGDQSLEKSRGGLGIGLSIVKRLVELHGGTVEAKSEGRGRGSEFVVRLPAVADAPRPVATDGAVGAVARRTVLVVDDNADAAETLGLMLSLMGSEVHTARDGLEAVERAAAVRPDLIFMDLGMPNLNGFDATRRIRSEPWGRAVRIFALTGWGQDEDRRKSHEAGCDGHLVKPPDPAVLERVLAETPARPPAG
jgi:PAS domain S-box-containing protein